MALHTAYRLAMEQQGVEQLHMEKQDMEKQGVKQLHMERHNMERQGVKRLHMERQNMERQGVKGLHMERHNGDLLDITHLGSASLNVGNSKLKLDNVLVVLDIKKEPYFC